MPEITPTVPACRFAVVSDYEAFPRLVDSLGLARLCCRVLHSPFPEDVRGLSLITDHIRPELAVYAASVTIVPINLPEDIDTPQAPLALLQKFAGEPQVYIVRGDSMVTTTVYGGGTTPVAMGLAERIIQRFKLTDVDADEMAASIDSVLQPERQAGAESEKMLLRIISAERDRRCSMEGAMRRQATGLSAQVAENVPDEPATVCYACFRPEPVTGSSAIAEGAPDVAPVEPKASSGPVT
jgi:hypothetical protein